MLRSSKKISIKSKTWQNYDGLLISPIIDINGFVLRSDVPVPEVMKEFIQSIGGIVKRVKIQGEIFIKLTGDFNVTKSEISEFLTRHSEITSKQLINLDSILEASTLKVTLSREYEARFSELGKTPLRFTDGSKVIYVKPTSMFVGKSMTIAYDDIFFQCARLFSRVNNKLEGKRVRLLGQKLEGFKQNIKLTLKLNEVDTEIPLETGSSSQAGPDVGLFNESMSLGATNIISQRNTDIVNCIVSAGGELEIDTGINGNLLLTIDKKVEWINNPYPGEFIQFLKHKSGTVYQLQDDHVIDYEEDYERSNSPVYGLSIFS